jgi:hypothetical protein
MCKRARLLYGSAKGASKKADEGAEGCDGVLGCCGYFPGNGFADDGKRKDADAPERAAVACLPGRLVFPFACPFSNFYFLVGRWLGGQAGERRRELAGREGVQGTEASSEFGGGQAALAVELAEKIADRALPFL